MEFTTSKKFCVPNIIKILCFSLLTSIAFTTDFIGFENPSYNVMAPILIFVFFVFYHFFEQKQYKQDNLVLLPAAFTAFFLLLGKTYSVTNSSSLIWGSKKRFLFFVLCLIGFTTFFQKLYQLILIAFAHLENTQKAPGWTDKILGGKFGFLKTSGIIFLAWLPILFLCYPGGYCNDANYQMFQALGRYSYDTIHPLTHTLFLGFCLKVGTFLGSYNRGLYLNILIQTVVMLFVMSYSLQVMYRKSVNKLYCILVLLLYCFAPLFSNFATMTIKDTLFNTWILLYVTILFDFVYAKDVRFTVKNVIKIVISATLVMLFRNNGLLVVAAAAFPLTFFLTKSSGKSIAKKITAVAVYIVLPFILFFVITSSLTTILKAESINGKEVLSIPFQQTARYVRDYLAEVTEEEWEAIQGVIYNPERLGQIYDPNISDPIKCQYVETTTGKEITGYLVVWVKMFFKHPMVYVEAFFNQIYGWFDLGVKNNIRYSSSNDLFYPPRWGDNSQLVQDLYTKVFSNPVLGILDNMAFYVWWTFLLIIFLYRKNNRKNWLIFLFPLIMSLLVCIASPCCLLHPRYAYPIAFTIPFLTGALIQGEKQSHLSKE